MRTGAAAVALVAATSCPVWADVFAFKDTAGFERCLATDHLVEKVTTDKGAQTRYLAQPEIQTRCVAAAVVLLGPLKQPARDLELIAAVKRLSATEQAIDLVAVLVGHGLAGCNEMSAYDVLTDALARSRDDHPASVFARGAAIIRRCLADKTFLADFLDEKDRDGELGRNACALLLEEKKVKACPKK